MIRLCIIGCGAVVEGNHARVLPAVSDRVRVTACYDLDRARARAMAKRLGAKRWGTPDDIAPDAGLWDAGLVATPPAQHAPIARLLIERGKHVLLEKPFTTTEADARALTAAAERAGVRLLVGHFRRFYPSVQAARAAVAGDELGGIEAIEVWEGARFDWPARSSYAFTSPDGGVTLDTGSHALDTLLFALGLDEDDGATIEIDACEKTPASEPSQDVRVRGRFRGSGLPSAPIGIHLSRLGPLATAVKVHGSRGTLVIPAAYAGAATLVRDGAPVPLPIPADARYCPPDANSAFHCEHVELARAISQPESASVLDAARFVGVTRIVERITAEAAS